MNNLFSLFLSQSYQDCWDDYERSTRSSTFPVWDYIVLTAWEDGAFAVNDPNSRIRSEKRWSYEELEGQIRNIWAITLQ